MTPDPRYRRQTLLPQVGDAGQARLRDGRVLVVGCGALGSATLPLLVRMGVGSVRLIDRDVVDPTNLHRQTLFTDADATAGRAKADAAAEHLSAANPTVNLDARTVDLTSDNARQLSADIDVIVDATDNVKTRYLLNDVAVSASVPLVYGACVGVEGRVMPIVPGVGPCLRCVYPTPPDARAIGTCDTVGVLPTVAQQVGAMQAALVARWLIERSLPRTLWSIDGWTLRQREIDLSDARDEDCPCCAGRSFEFLNDRASDTAVLCGRDAVQVRTNANASRSAHTIDRFALDGEGVTVTRFADGRCIVHGTSDVKRARSIVARYIGD